MSRNLERSRRFYTEVLGFKISDVYPGNMMPGGMVFLRPMAIIIAWRWSVARRPLATQRARCITWPSNSPRSTKCSVRATI